MTDKPPPTEPSADLRAYLESVPAATAAMTERIARANRALQDDPLFQAEYLKSLFVEEMYEALAERRETKAVLARRLGKPRQYVQKIFNEDKRVNFTIETLCAIAHAVGRRVRLRIDQKDKSPLTLTHSHRAVTINSGGWTQRQPMRAPSLQDDQFVPVQPSPSSFQEEETHGHATAA